MTTIAYRDGIMAADTQAENGGWIMPGRANKLRRLHLDEIAGVTGDWEAFESWLEWYAGKRTEPHDLGENARVIVASEMNGITVYEGKGWFRVNAPFCAFGSGSPIAIAAMHMGASARRAVEVAALVDPYTGGEIEEMVVSGDASSEFAKFLADQEPLGADFTADSLDSAIADRAAKG